MRRRSATSRNFGDIPSTIGIPSLGMSQQLVLQHLSAAPLEAPHVVGRVPWEVLLYMNAIPPHKQLIKDDAHAIDVRSSAEMMLSIILRVDIDQCPLGARLHIFFVANAEGDPQVPQLDTAIGMAEDVVWLHIPVDDDRLV